MPPGEHVRINVSVQVFSEDSRALLDAWNVNDAAFSVTVSYSDADGRQRLTSRAIVRKYATRAAYVQQIAISHEGDAEPFVISGESHA